MYGQIFRNMTNRTISDTPLFEISSIDRCIITCAFIFAGIKFLIYVVHLMLLFYINVVVHLGILKILACYQNVTIPFSIGVRQLA